MVSHFTITNGAVPLSFTWDWLVVVIAKWCVIEPRLIKALSGFEEPDWAVKVIITVEDEGFGELERDSGFASSISCSSAALITLSARSAIDSLV